MHSISKFITNEYLIEEKSIIQNVWKKLIIDLQIHQNENSRIEHFQTLKNIFQNIQTAMFYTDAAFDSTTKILTASCVLYQNTKVAYKTWNLEIEMSINDAELYAIEKATKWSKTLKNTSHI